MKIRLAGNALARSLTKRFRCCLRFPRMRRYCSCRDRTIKKKAQIRRRYHALCVLRGTLDPVMVGWTRWTTGNKIRALFVSKPKREFLSIPPSFFFFYTLNVTCSQDWFEIHVSLSAFENCVLPISSSKSIDNRLLSSSRLLILFNLCQATTENHPSNARGEDYHAWGFRGATEVNLRV